MHNLKLCCDGVAISAAFAALVGWLPPLAAAASLLYTLLLTYDWLKKHRVL